MSIQGTATIAQVGVNSVTLLLENTEDTTAEVGFAVWEQLPEGRLKALLTKQRVTQPEETTAELIKGFFAEAAQLGLRTTLMGHSGAAMIPVAYWTVFDPALVIPSPNSGYPLVIVENMGSTSLGDLRFASLTISIAHSLTE